MAIASTILPAARGAFLEGPYPAMTGGFGEPTCRHCHFDRPPTEPRGAVSLSGIPVHYTPGARYLVAVLLRRPDLTRGGFQFSARFADGPRAGRQAGLLEPTDDRVQTVAALTGDVRYIQHNKAGAETATSGELRWVVRWTAPADGANDVVFHVAANASNADDSPLGDYVYTAEAHSRVP